MVNVEVFADPAVSDELEGSAVNVKRCGRFRCGFSDSLFCSGWRFRIRTTIVRCAVRSVKFFTRVERHASHIDHRNISRKNQLRYKRNYGNMRNMADEKISIKAVLYGNVCCEACYIQARRARGVVC